MKKKLSFIGAIILCSQLISQNNAIIISEEFEESNFSNLNNTTIIQSTQTTTINSRPNSSNQSSHVIYVQGYNGPIGCLTPMSALDFQRAKQSIASKNVEDSKLAIAKQILNSNCLLSSQVRGIMSLFSFEDSKLEFAKYAYGHTYDIGNYYKLNDAFQFETSIDELNSYIGDER